MIYWQLFMAQDHSLVAHIGAKLCLFKPENNSCNVTSLVFCAWNQTVNNKWFGDNLVWNNRLTNMPKQCSNCWRCGKRASIDREGFLDRVPQCKMVNPKSYIFVMHHLNLREKWLLALLNGHSLLSISEYLCRSCNMRRLTLCKIFGPHAVFTNSSATPKAGWGLLIPICACF